MSDLRVLLLLLFYLGTNYLGSAKKVTKSKRNDNSVGKPKRKLSKVSRIEELLSDYHAPAPKPLEGDRLLRSLQQKGMLWDREKNTDKIHDLRLKQITNPSNVSNYLQLIVEYGKAWEFEEAMGVLGLMQRHRITVDSATITELLGVVSKSPNIRYSYNVLRVIQSLNMTITIPMINSLIDAAGQVDNMNLIVDLFQYMECSGLRPNRKTFHRILSHVGRMVDTHMVRYFVRKMMIEYNITWTRKSFEKLKQFVPKARRERLIRRIRLYVRALEHHKSLWTVDKDLSKENITIEDVVQAEQLRPSLLE
mmetsp:Transcript_930/g.1302  ORF Transcript_930/g.1302 Transcript_930/m.1302 type:complete len:308 (+) Transcript_930:105-1028(+)|eukprot:CAMPEP_0167746766 /NCGR_PEP_ID=MMETSP0110_2-20121227/3900_1 /TAXON_ID=629695 /ORGANISM="Gymnochlora sp., Strain CCMP2014" /LENGTH=307 /DNA_ID=CAMNT_0007631577 /DNA_START=48 /DNA_END=971 /DNA_ORIENTATION=+